MKEKDIQTDFKKFNKVEGVFELKLLKANESGKFPPIPFNAVKDHQVQALVDASGNGDGLYHKISDSFIGDKSGQRRFPSPKPFDCFLLKRVPAFVVVCYYIPRKLKLFCYIPIRQWIRQIDIATRKSLPPDVVEHISQYIVKNGEYVFTRGETLEADYGVMK